MTSEEKLNKIYEITRKLGGKVMCNYEDDFCAYDYVGSNVDDAWEYGMADGERGLANIINDIYNGK